MAEDLSSLLGDQVEMRLYDVTAYPGAVRAMPGINLDTLTLSEGDIVNAYETEPAYLKFDENRSETATETFSTSVFRSLCPVTGQPDLASILISYTGKAIDQAGLLKYLVSYRCHRGFHEQCVEQIFHDLRAAFAPEMLEVYACFTRRGGIDINPFRSSMRDTPDEIIREMRQ